MELTLNYMMHILGKYLQHDASAEEKLLLVEAWYHAVLRHLPKQDGLTEKKVGKVERKEPKESGKGQKKRT